MLFYYLVIFQILYKQSICIIKPLTGNLEKCIIASYNIIYLNYENKEISIPDV